MAWVAVAAIAVGVVGSVYSASQQRRQNQRQAQLQERQGQLANEAALLNAQTEREFAGDRAEKLRKGGRRQKAAATAAIAASGAGGLSAGQIENYVTSGAEADAMAEILGGERRAQVHERGGNIALQTGFEQASLLNEAGRDAFVGGLIGGVGSALGGVARMRKPGYTYQTQPTVDV